MAGDRDEIRTLCEKDLTPGGGLQLCDSEGSGVRRAKWKCFASVRMGESESPCVRWRGLENARFGGMVDEMYTAGRCKVVVAV